MAQVVMPHNTDAQARHRQQWSPNSTPRWSSHHCRRPFLIKALILIRYSVLFVAIFLCTHALVASSYNNRPVHYSQLTTRCHYGGKSALAGCANAHAEKIFISVSLYDPDGGLAGGRWGEQLVDLVNLLGPKDVFVSIYENDSGRLGADSLVALRDRFRCRHSIVNEPHVSLDGFPTVALPDGSEQVKRTIYLAEMRNRALEPLSTMTTDELGVSSFDKILFLNDIIFDPIDAAHLLFDTNRGTDGHAHYLTACALDFYYDPWMVYDSYAMRDADGYSIGEAVFPYFSTAGRGLSRAAMLAQSDAVPVKSCWGGMVAMQAAYVQGGNGSSANRPALASSTIDPDNPADITRPVRFRGEPDAFYDACECCLFLADASLVAAIDSATEQGVFINPYVRTAYSDGVFKGVGWVKLWERLLVLPQRYLSWKRGKPYTNPYRNVAQGDAFQEEVWMPASAGRNDSGWQMVDRKGRNGLFCGLRMMQVIKPREDGKGYHYEDIPIPAGYTFDAHI